eukprot:Hpha_TRINITY_DN15055_c4_g7::TRINITY_DN15055_c4_g7_i1::g.126244::m.126244
MFAGVLALSVFGAGAPTVPLNNGVDMPIMAFGAQVWDDNTCQQATADALQAGFRFVWSSMLIGQSCQQRQAVAIHASGIPRSELFIAGTVNTAACSGETECYSQTQSYALQQFQILNVSTLDQLMLDYPASSGGCPSLLGQWRAFQELYNQKKVRSIAVSNFAVDQLECVIANGTNVVPTVNQVQYSVGHGADTAVADNAKLGVVLQAYSPLNHGSLVTDPDCVKIGQAHNKTSAQVALRWIVQRNSTICTEATDIKYLQQDTDIFDFTLSPAEMQTLNAKSV